MNRRAGLYTCYFSNPEENIPGMTKDLRSMGLTRREVEVVHLLAKGSKNAEIAERLCISEDTVVDRVIVRHLSRSPRPSAGQE